MVAFIISWVVSIIGIFYALPFVNYLTPDKTHYPVIAGINVLFLLGIPIASIILLITRILFGTRVHPRWKAGMIGFMILNAISLSYVATHTASEFNTSTTQSQGIDLSSITSDTIKVSAKENPYDNTWFQLGDELKFTEEHLIVELKGINIRKSEGEDFELIQDNHARGTTLDEAKELAIGITYQIDQQAPNQISIPTYLQIPRGNKWRNQQVHLTLKVPVGKTIIIDESVKLHHVDLDNHRINPWKESGKIWRMETTGLVCINCDNRDNEQKKEFSEFDRLKIDGNLKVQIDQGSHYNVSLTGRNHYIEQVDIVKTERTLNISADLEGASSPVRLYITMPKLDDIQIEGTDDLSIRGFKQPVMQIVHKGRDEVKAYLEVDSLIVRQTDHSKLDLYGQYQHLDAHIKDKAKLDAEKATLKTANLQVFESSSATLPLLSDEALKYEMDEQSTIQVEGRKLGN